jgi:hypothetical protein
MLEILFIVYVSHKYKATWNGRRQLFYFEKTRTVLEMNLDVLSFKVADIIIVTWRSDRHFNFEVAAKRYLYFQLRDFFCFFLDFLLG